MNSISSETGNASILVRAIYSIFSLDLINQLLVQDVLFIQIYGRVTQIRGVKEYQFTC